MKSPRLLAGVAAMAVGLAGVSVAQTPSRPSAPPPPSDQMWMQHRLEREGLVAQAAHDILRIRPDQEAAFQAVISSMNAMGDHDWMDRDRDVDDLAHMTTPELLDRMTSRMADREAAMRRHIAAVRTLYAQLDPDQRRSFDALVVLMMGQRHMGGFEHMHGRGM